MNISSTFKNTSFKPQPLFQYWGHFYKNAAVNSPTNTDDQSETEEPVDLWGDWGHDGIPNNQDHLHENDGEICPVELNYLYRAQYGLTTEPFHRVGIDPSGNKYFNETPENGVWVPQKHDFNGNGLYDRTLDDVISKIVITVTTEERYANIEHSNPRIICFTPHIGIDNIKSYKYYDSVQTKTVHLK